MLSFIKLINWQLLIKKEETEVLFLRWQEMAGGGAGSVMITGASGLLGRAILKTFAKEKKFDHLVGIAFSR
jgi:hypothetical protein